MLPVVAVLFVLLVLLCLVPSLLPFVTRRIHNEVLCAPYRNDGWRRCWEAMLMTHVQVLALLRFFVTSSVMSQLLMGVACTAATALQLLVQPFSLVYVNHLQALVLFCCSVLAMLNMPAAQIDAAWSARQLATSRPPTWLLAPCWRRLL